MPSRRSFLAAGSAALSGMLAGCSSFSLSRSPDGTDWSASVPELATLSSPTVAGDSLAVGGVRNGDIERGRVAAFDTESGDRHWRRDIGRLTGLTATNDAVYVGEKDDAGARVLSFDARSGERRWAQSVDNLASALTVADGVLYAANGSLAALETADGSVRWERASAGGADFTVVAAPDDQLAADDRAVYFGHSGGVVALDPSDGRLVWAWRPENWSATTVGPVPVGDRLYVAADGALAALDATAGEVRWRTSFGADARVQGVHETEATLLVAEATDEAPSDSFGTIYELSLADGRERYETRFEEPVVRTASTAETFVVGTASGRITWTGGASSFDRSETTIPSETFALSARGEQAFAQTGEGTLYALSPPE